MANTDMLKNTSGKKVGNPSVKDKVKGFVKGDKVGANLRALYDPFLPSDLVAGSIPYIAGAEEESVWNAAVQACGTERIHYVYTIEDGRCWYIATPSSSLASNPDTWCPLVAALPGNSEHWDRETVYLYEQDGHAAALRWDGESGRMQLYLGAARTILPKVQTLEANFVTINAENAEVYLWKNAELRTDALTQTVGKILVISGVFVGILTALYIMVMFAIANVVQPKLDTAKAETEMATLNLLKDASESLENDTIRHVFRVQELLDTLSQIDGTLVKYEVDKAGKLTWEALVPRTFAAVGNKALRSAQPVDNKLEADGRVRIRGTQ